LLDGEALGLTRRAVEAALAGDMLAMKLCLERLLPRCQTALADGGRRDNSSKGLIQPRGKILLLIFCRCRKRKSRRAIRG
jgi:hypothetical protein